MPTYQLQIKQVVDYPRCRIYRQFVRFLMEDRNIRVSGGSGLFVASRLNKTPWFYQGVSEEALAKEKVKNIVGPTKEKERYGDSERKAGIFVKSFPLAECYEIPKRTGLPVAARAMR